MCEQDPLDIAALRRAVMQELEARRFADGPGCFANRRGGAEALYGLTGAANIHAVLGVALGDRNARRQWAQRVLAQRGADGFFVGDAGPGHGIHMVLGALNLLGEPIPAALGPLAPDASNDLPAWLDGLDWSGTHKEFCGQTIPRLATGCVARDWVDTLVRHVTARIDPERPMEIWCGADDPPWRVISCMYHVLVAFDAGALPYPYPQWLLRRLLDMHWEEAPDETMRTACTDGDWAWMLMRLASQCPEHYGAAMRAVRRVSARRIRLMRARTEEWLSESTHNIYCHLWVTAVFQSLVREHYRGGYLWDTLNAPALYRMNESLAKPCGAGACLCV
jgi:hypothetical protein